MAGTAHSAVDSHSRYSRRATWLAFVLPVVGTAFALGMAYLSPMRLTPLSNDSSAGLLISVAITLVAALLIIGPSFYSALGHASQLTPVFGCLIGFAMLLLGYLLSNSLFALNPGVLVPLPAILGAGIVFALWPMTPRHAE